MIETALPLLKDFKNIILVEANDPVAFFAYPNKPSMLKPEGCEVHRLTAWGENSVAALEALSDALRATPQDVKPQQLVELTKPTGALTHASIAQAIAMAIPENAIIVDESITTGRGFFPPTAAAAPHDWLQNMGGSIGFSTPIATGAAVACPDRKVICMVGDGSAMYTLQSLWTQAREGLNVLTIVFANRIYQILRGEFDGVGAGEPGQRALDMLKIDRPDARLCFACQRHGRAGPLGDQCRRVQQGAGGRCRRKGAAADRSADVSGHGRAEATPSFGRLQLEKARCLSGRALSFWLSMISAQTLRVCREGKPVSTFPDHALEPFPFRLNRNGGSTPLFDAFSSREPVSTSLENALGCC